MRRLDKLSCLLALALAAACGETKPKAPRLELQAAGDSVATNFSAVTEAVWLGGDRWAVIAPSNEAVGIADFSKHRYRPLGGKPSVRNPTTIFRAGDTLFVGDWGLGRVTLWTADGRLLRSVPTSSALRGALPKARDQEGRYYLALYPRPGPDGSGNRDSAAVIQTDSGFGRPDTIARLAPLDIAEVRAEAGRRFEPRVFGGVDKWGALPDGSLWLARVFGNRVDWRSPDGKWTRGQALPDRVLEVTRYDRELFVRGFPPELRGRARELPFSPLKPPFESAMNSPTGEVWLEKSRAPTDSTRGYHLVDRSGRLTRDVALRGQGRIIGVGRDAVVVAESTPDGTDLVRVPILHSLPD
jgi:hypothetical protein